MAKLAFIVVAAVLTPTIIVVASAITTLWLALAIGLAAGLAVATVVYVVVLIWPAIRLVWYWIGEITTLAVLLATYLGLTRPLPWPVALTILTATVGTPLAIPRSRRWLTAWCWCAIARHRLRTCFATFIRANRYGSLPWILSARPTPAGERVWVWLRPGLSLADLQTESGLDRLAVGCWAKQVKISRARRRNNSALLRVDITRRNPLADTIGSPITSLIPTLPDIYPTDPANTMPETAPVDMAALDLPGVLEPTSTSSTAPANAARPTPRATTPSPARRPEPAITTTRTGEDLSEWV